MAYNKIMVPVDLAHTERLDKAIVTAADLARHYRIPVCFVGVTAGLPTEVAQTPEEFADKLSAFGLRQSIKHDLPIDTAAYHSHDPAADLDHVLLGAIDDTRADLVVMASHIPGLAEHFFSSNAGHVASHAKVSVFVVR